MREYPSHVSTILRLHTESGLEALLEALRSLRAQTYLTVQVVVCLENLSDEFSARVATEIGVLWHERPLSVSQGLTSAGLHRVKSIHVAEGFDGRATLLNEGIQLATGRWIGFLDYDDILLPNAYSTLVDRLKSTDAGVAVGGCLRVVSYGPRARSRYVEKYWAPKMPVRLIELVYGNTIPIHSYLIDRTRLNGVELSFDVAHPLLEDYRLLLKLVAAGIRFDFEKITEPVCEYRFRLDDSNSVPSESASSEKRRLWNEAHRSVREFKQDLKGTFSFSEINEVIQEREELRARLEHLKFSFYVKRIVKALCGPVLFLRLKSYWARLKNA